MLNIKNIQSSNQNENAQNSTNSSQILNINSQRRTIDSLPNDSEIMPPPICQSSVNKRKKCELVIHGFRYYYIWNMFSLRTKSIQMKNVIEIGFIVCQ